MRRNPAIRSSVTADDDEDDDDDEPGEGRFERGSKYSPRRVNLKDSIESQNNESMKVK